MNEGQPPDIEKVPREEGYSSVAAWIARDPDNENVCIQEVR
jgi:hypothetical protein